MGLRVTCATFGLGMTILRRELACNAETSMSADARVAPPSATVVIAQKVRPGREKEYLCWQAEMDVVCHTFPGCEAAEVVPPVAGAPERLRRGLPLPHVPPPGRLAQVRCAGERFSPAGWTLFVGDARQQVVAAPHAASVAAGMVVSTRVKPGREAEYRAWQTTIDHEAARFPGFLGNEVLPPVPGLQEEWVVVVRFDSAEHLKNWLESEPRRRLNAAGGPAVGRGARRELRRWLPRLVHPRPGRVEQGRAPAGVEAGHDRAPGSVSDRLPAVVAICRRGSPACPSRRRCFVANVVSVSILTLAPDARRGPRVQFLAEPAVAPPSAVRGPGLLAVLAGYAVAVFIFMLML